MNVRLVSCFLAAGTLASVASAQPATITEWNFNNGTSGAINNAPAPSKGQGTAVPLGMTNGYTYSTSPVRTGSYTACDITGGGGSGDTAATNNCWRVRGSYDGTLGNAGVGYALAAPQRTQGAEFDVSTVNYENIVFSFDWFCTNQGVHCMQIQYSLNAGATWVTVDNTPLGVDITAGASSAVVNGGFVSSIDQTILNSATNGWINGTTVDFSNVPGADDNPNFRVRLVTVYDPGYSGAGSPCYTSPTGAAPYNNNSGNWRFDRVGFVGTPIRSISPSITAAVDKSAVCTSGGALKFTAIPTGGLLPASTGITVTGDMTALGIVAPAAFQDNGLNGDAFANDGVYTYVANVAPGRPVGPATVGVTINDAELRSASTSVTVSIGDCSQNSASRVVVSQTFGGGGRLGEIPSQDAPYNADYVELYNRSALPVSLNGWSVQYSSPTSGGGFDNPGDQVLLSGTIQPGQYMLVRMSDTVPGFNPLPTPDFAQLQGFGGMGNTGGRVAVVRSTVLLGTNYNDPNIEDLVGYGDASLFEGIAAGPTPNPSSNTAILRKLSGAQDTNQNFNDFIGGTPNARNRAFGGFLAGVGSVGTSAVCAGNSVKLTVNVTPGTSSTGIQVFADVAQITGVPGSVQLFDDGPAGGHGDANINDGVYTLDYLVPGSAAQGNRTITFTVSDTQAHTDVSSVPLAVANCGTSTAPVVISQVYGGGGNSTSGFNADFAEIHNRSANPVSLDGWSFQSARVSDLGFDSRIVLLSGTIPPGGYRLIVTNQSNTTGAVLPPADFVPATTFGMESSFGRVVLVSSTNLVNTDYTRSDVVDLVGYGSASQSFEGVAPTGTLDNIYVAVRKQNGCQDTNQNAIDFDVVLALTLPRNSASPAVICACSKADVAGLGGSPSPDGQLTVDDLVFYLSQFFSNNFAVADLTNLGGTGAPDGLITVDDLVAFLSAFFAGCQ